MGKLVMPAVAIPPALAAVMGLVGVTVPSFWRDESVSALAASMPLSSLWRLLGVMDAVHALYYLLLRPFAAIATSELVLRLPSVLAVSAAAYGVAMVGRRLASERAGVIAGIIYALLPIVSRYAQETRGYALVSAVAVLAAWTLLNALDDPRRSRYAIYAASLALLGWLHLYALLLIAAHAATVLLWNRRELLRWTLAVVGALVAVAPLVLIASREQGQVAWLRRPHLSNLVGFAYQVGGTWWGVALLVVLGVAGAVVSIRHFRPLAVMALPWAVLPIALSFTISQVHPVYNPRYILFCVPGFALMAGAGLARTAAISSIRAKLAERRALAPPALVRSLMPALVPVLVPVLLAVLTLPAQVAIRQPDSRPDDLRAAANSLAAQEKPGDGLLFVPYRYRLFVGVYARPYQALRDLTFAPGHFKPRGPVQFRRLADTFQRIWIVSSPPHLHWKTDRRCQALLHDPRFRETRIQTIGRVYLTLFSRRPSNASARR
jgi:mannosyltransferase